MSRSEQFEQAPPEWAEDEAVEVVSEQPVDDAPQAVDVPVEAEPVSVPVQRAKTSRSAHGRYDDVPSEQQIIGWMLMRPAEVERVTTRLTGEEFYNPDYRRLFELMHDRWSKGLPTDPASLASEFPFADLIDLQALCEIVAPEALIGELVELAQRRRLARTFSDGLSQLAGAGMGEHALEVLAAAEGQLATVSSLGGRIESVAQSWHDVSMRHTDESPWVIDGLLRERHRMVIVAGEGGGKTTFLRQLAFCASLGLHPFTRRPLKNGPVVTLTVDLENPRDQVAGIASWLAKAAHATDRGPTLPAVNHAPAHIVEWEGGIDIRRRPDRARFEAELRAVRPGLLIVGPLYKLYQKKGNESDEEVAAEVCSILDDWRVRFNCAMALEHHAPHGFGGNRKLRPVGSSYWLRWPEFGITMQRNKDLGFRYDLGRFRGDRVVANWPTAVDRRGSAWPLNGHYAKGTVGQDDPAPFEKETAF